MGINIACDNPTDKNNFAWLEKAKIAPWGMVRLPRRIIRKVIEDL